MFDIGFSEFIVIGIVALIVLGPERLPKVARTTGHLLGRLQRYVADVKSDINREMQLDELKKLQEDARQAAMQMDSSLRGEATKLEGEMNSAFQGLASTAADQHDALNVGTAAPGEVPAEPDPQIGFDFDAPVVENKIAKS